MLIKQKYIISKFLKILFRNGKKAKFEILLKKAFAYIKKNLKNHPLYIFIDFIKKGQPFCELKSLKIKGSIQRVPVELTITKQKSLTLRWLTLNAAITLSNKTTLVESLTNEIMDTINLLGRTVKNCNEIHKISELNRIFTQFKN